MNKTELIDVMASKADLGKNEATRALDAFIDAVTEAIAAGDAVALVGFATLSVKERAARTGRNPRTGEEMQIKATVVPVFKAGKALKDAAASSAKTTSQLEEETV